MAAVTGVAQAESQALKTLAAAAGTEVSIQEPGAAVPADKGSFFQRWGADGGEHNGFFKPWNKSAEVKMTGDMRVYRNAAGCEATVEERRNGNLIYVREAGGQQAWLWLGKDMNSGEITSFCSPAAVSAGSSSVKLSCGEHANGGYYTRGEAVIGFNGGLSSVSVRGEVKKALGWKTDTNISCSGLRPADTRSAKSASAFMGVQACSALDGIYPADMTAEEADAMLGGCFSGISAKYGVPVTFSAEGTELVIMVGRSENGQIGAGAKVTGDLKRELAARDWRMFDFKASIAVEK